jgi:hypothetical protein
MAGVDAVKGDAWGLGGRATVEVNGKRVVLTPEGLEQARGSSERAAEKRAESVREAVERATDG